MNDRSGGQPGAFIDRSRWLIVVGVVEILIGCACALIGALFALFPTFFTAGLSAGSSSNARTAAFNALMLCAPAVLFVWLGAGTMRARRWARDMMLVTAWFWLAAGVIALGLMLFVFPSLLSRMSDSAQVQLSGSGIAAAMLVFAFVLGFPYVVLPGIFVWFYSNGNVKWTFEVRDPVARWTGKCPLSALTVSQFLAGGSILFLMTPVISSSMPFFGGVLRGFPFWLFSILSAVVSACLAWAIYKLKPQAWWVNLIFTVMIWIWSLASYGRPDLTGASASEGTTFRIGGQALGMMDILGSKLVTAAIATSGAAWVVFLIFTKKHFKKSR